MIIGSNFSLLAVEAIVEPDEVVVEFPVVAGDKEPDLGELDSDESSGVAKISCAKTATR